MLLSLALFYLNNSGHFTTPALVQLTVDPPGFHSGFSGGDARTGVPENEFTYGRYGNDSLASGFLIFCANSRIITAPSCGDIVAVVHYSCLCSGHLQLSTQKLNLLAKATGPQPLRLCAGGI